MNGEATPWSDGFFKLRVELGGTVCSPEDVAAMLEKVAAGLRDNPLTDDDLLDRNGDMVGSYEIEGVSF